MVSRASLSCESRDTNCLSVNASLLLIACSPILVLQEDVSIPLLALLDGGRGHGRVPVGAPEVVDVLPLLRSSNVVLQRAQVSPANRRDLEIDKLEEVLHLSAEVLLHVLDDASLVVAGIALEELRVLLQFLLAVLVQEQQHAAHDGLLRFSVSRVPRAE